MANTYDLLIKIGGSLSGSYLSTIGKVQKGIGSLEKATKPATGAIGSLGGKLLGLAGGVVAGITLDKVTETANASAKSIAQMNAVLKSTGDASGMTQQQLIGLAESQSKLTTFSDETTESAENMLLTFTNIKSNVFPQTLQITEDMATAMHTDATSAALTLGKALNDPAKGMSKLTKQGVTFTAAQEKQIAAMEKAGNTAGAQKIMLAELTREFGGSAKAQGDTLEGELTKTKNSAMEAAKTALQAVLPIASSVMPMLVGGVQKVSGLIQAHQGDIQNVVKSVLHIGQIAGNAVLPAMESIFKTVAPIAKQAFPAIERAIQGIGKAAGDVVSGIKQGWTHGFTQMQTPLQTLAVIAGTVFSNISNVAQKVLSFFQAHKADIQKIANIISGSLNSALGSVFTTVQNLIDFIITHQMQIKTALVGIGTAVAGIKVVQTVKLVTSGFKTVLAGIKGLQSAAKGAKFLSTLFGVSPQALLIIGIIAAVAALAFVIIKNWKPISAFFVGLWNGVVGAFNSAKEHIAGFFTGIGNFFKQWGPLILTAIFPVLGIPLLIIQHFSQIKTFFQGLWNDVTGGFKGFINMIIQGINGLIGGLDKFNVTLPNWLPGVGGKTLGFAIPQIPQLAEGGVVSHRSGGILANIGEGKYDEAIVPLKNGNSGDTGNSTFVYSPNNYFYGNVSKSDVQQVTSDDRAKFRRMMEDYENDKRRRSPSGKPVPA